MHFVLRHIPLERILKLDHPEKAEGVKEDKRTWRGEKPLRESGNNGGDGGGRREKWTTMDVLTAYALKNGWVTAKAGRPDVNRAGNTRKSLFSPSLCSGSIRSLMDG